MVVHSMMASIHLHDFWKVFHPLNIALWAQLTRTRVENSEIFIGWLCSLIFSWFSLQSHLSEPLLLSMFQIFLPNILLYINHVTEPHFNVLWPILAVKDCGVLVQALGDWTARCPVYFSRPDILSWLQCTNLCPASLCLSCFDQLSAGLALLGFLLSLFWHSFHEFWTLLLFISITHAYILGVLLVPASLDASNHLCPHRVPLCSNTLGYYCSSNCLFVVFFNLEAWYYKFHLLSTFI